MSENRKIRVFYQFNGYVQGVGFRYRMSHLAGHFGVTGWVRNEYDGSVQAELQGLPEEIDMIIQRLCQDRYIEIRSMDRKELPLDVICTLFTGQPVRRVFLCVIVMSLN
ncbi:acylphosphatase [Roseburia sp. CLA-AA-H209]|nr:acylphosphatase [Roseburia sp. CLA-AA-H209]MCC2225170.1 acylphosphatase [Roseburia sp. CLA-AA-H209]